MSDEYKTKIDLDNLVWVKLEKPFLVVKETLNRIGVASKKENTLYQSCHILHKKGRYAIVHFKELYILDGKGADLSEHDIARRNTIVNLLVEWGLVTLEKPEQTKEPTVSIGTIKIITSSDKKNWKLVSKHPIEQNKGIQNEQSVGDTSDAS
jgi:hypothetical protein